jgi:hypothetical protein
VRRLSYTRGMAAFPVLALYSTFAFSVSPAFAQSAIIPSDVLDGPLTVSEHPHADLINAFLQRQAAGAGSAAGFVPTGLGRADYLPVIDSITRAMAKFQNSAGRVIDPILAREHQYSTSAQAHSISVLFKSGYVPPSDTGLLNAGIRAMTAAISYMVADNVPDSHGDFCTVLIMQAFENFKGIVPVGTQASWRTSLGSIVPANVYNNSAPNWIGFNIAGEFLRYKEKLPDSATSLNWAQSRVTFQVGRMGADGLYQDVNTIDTAHSPVANIDGNSLAYDNVARGMLGVLARSGYSGTSAAALNRALWKGGWTGLLYQSPAGEVPTGMRSSHHLWNEGFAAANYEMWAREYALAGRPDIAGAFKRAAMLSLMSHKQWLRPAGTLHGGSGYVTKARYPAASQWGYMAYSGLTNYNTLAASALAMAWQIADTTITERPAPADIGGYVLPVLPGFKKVFANAGGTYVEYDVRGDQSHNPTGLVRIHLKSSLPQLGPSDGLIGTHISSAQYWPIYPTENPTGLVNTGVGPGWLVAGGVWKTLGALQRIPTLAVLEQTTERASFRVSYAIDSGSTLHETVVVTAGGVTVTDSVTGGGITDLRMYYPFLVNDGEQQSTVQVSGNTVTLGLRGKGARYSVLRPPGTTLLRSTTERNHRNGRADLAYAGVTSRVTEYRVTAWPEYVPTAVEKSPEFSARSLRGPVLGFDGAFLIVAEPGEHRVEIRTLTGRILWTHAGTGHARYDLRAVGRGEGVLFLSVSARGARTVRKVVL